MLLNDICQPFAENLFAAAQRNNFNDIVTANMKNVSARAKLKSEFKKFGIHSDYAVSEFITMQQETPTITTNNIVFGVK